MSETTTNCRTCGEPTAAPRFYVATDPAGYECSACYRGRVNRDDAEDPEATPLEHGDDPDDRIDWGNVREFPT